MAGARIITRELHRAWHIGKAGKGIPERSNGDGDVPLAAPHIIARKSKLQVLRRLETDLLPEEVWAGRKFMPCKRAEEIGEFEWSQKFREAGNIHRLLAVDLDHPERCGVIAHQ